jgi:hypothetical protein
MAVALGGCAMPANLGDLTATQNPLTMREVYLVQATYDTAFLAPAANYRRLGLCAPSVKSTLAKPCAEREVVLALQAADKKVEVSMRDLKAYVQAYPGEVGAKGLYDAAILAVNQAKALLAVYNIGKGLVAPAEAPANG